MEGKIIRLKSRFRAWILIGLEPEAKFDADELYSLVKEFDTKVGMLTSRRRFFLMAEGNLADTVSFEFFEKLQF